MTKHTQNPQAGMTIVELLVAVVVTALVSTVILNFSIDSIRTSSIQTAKSELLDDARNGLDRVANDIRISTVADQNNRWDDSNSPGAPGNLLSWSSDASTLILATSAMDSGRNIIFDDPLNYITEKNNLVYFVSNGTLYRRILAAPVTGNTAKTSCPEGNATATCPTDAVVIRNVSNFQVRYINANDIDVVPSEARAIELQITVTDDVFGESVSASYVTRMVFRNG